MIKVTNKNILIVTENFSLGGLETHILSNCEALKKLGHKIFVATSENATLDIIEDYVTSSLLINNFSSMVGEDVQNHFYLLKDFIVKNKIDYIQIHPYISAIVAAAVANHLNIPYSYTAHGPLNFSSTYGETYKSLVFEKVLTNAHQVYAVSPEVEGVITKNVDSANIKVLPNVVNVEKSLMNASSDVEKDRITIISRIDQDKFAGIVAAIEHCKQLVKHPSAQHLRISIVGDGSKIDDLKELIKEDDTIQLEGYSDNVHEYIVKSKFVCGMGRVVLESGAQDVPVVLIGYDGVKGFVTQNNINALSETNFSGRNVENMSADEMLNQFLHIELEPQLYSLQSWVKENRGINVLLAEYMSLLSSGFEKKENWSADFIEICERLEKDNLLSNTNMVYFADLVKITDQKIKLSLLNEIAKIQEEKRLTEVELGMVRQNLFDEGSKNVELNKKYSEILMNVNDLSSQFIKREEALMNHLTNVLESSEKVNLNQFKELLQEKEHQLLSLNQAIQNLESHLFEKDNQIISLNQYIENTNGQLNLNNQLLNEISQKTYDIYGSRYFKLVNLMQRVNLHFVKGTIKEKKEFLKWFTKKLKKEKYVSTNKVSHPLDQVLSILEKRYATPVVNNDGGLPAVKEASAFEAMYNQKKTYLTDYLSQVDTDRTLDVKAILNSKQYKGIVVYPQAVFWEPMQRPQQFLREFAKKGYLCIFCAPFEGEFEIKEYEENLFIVNDEAAVLSAVKTKYPIVLCTWQGQKAFIDLLPNKLLWYDLLDQLEFFADTDEKTIEAHYEVLANADIVSYSADMLHKYVQSRKDALLLPNASNLTDFLANSALVEKQKINSKGRKVVGYFGAVEEWFDVELINKLVENNKELFFVIIGHVSPNVQFKESENLILLGKVDYAKLMGYALQFDVAIIPFKVNDLTNCVSPVKYFEYRALGLPVVTTPIHEMKKYKDDYGVFLADTYEQFEDGVLKAVQINKADLQESAKDFVLNNQWKSRIDLVEKRLESDFKHFRAFANYVPAKHISVMTGTFLGLDGEQFYSGGAERYLIDLHEVAKNKNLNLIVYQYGTYAWTRRFKNIEVRSLARGTQRMQELSVENVRKYNSNFYEEENGNSILNIYSAFFEAWPKTANPSIGISHGVAWDSTHNQDLNSIKFWEQNRRIIESAKMVDKMVSVDTNTTNWFQTIDFETGNKMEYVPNYVDPEIFKPVVKEDNRIVISYPRRLYGARGLYLVLEILDEILEKYPNVDFHFVGKGFEEDTKYVEQKIKKWKNRVQWYSLDPSEMHKAYEIADISLVPTLHSEGTSLSCLEAMASGNAVISTRIGGLTDLVINNFNGLLIEPNSNALKTAIEKLLSNPNMLKSIQNNAIEVSKVFSKAQWSEKWSQIIQGYVGAHEDVEQLSTMKTMHYYVKDSKDLDRFTASILKHIYEGFTVMVFMQNMMENREQLSFGRIQFLTFEEDVFDPGDYSIASTKLKERLKNYRTEINEFI